MGENLVVEVVKAPSFWGVAIVLLGFGMWFLRDVKNPEKAASTAVLTGLTATTAGVFEMAQKAIDQASEAAGEAHKAAMAQVRCERMVAGLTGYIYSLTNQLVSHGITPIEPPPGLLDE